MTVNKGVIKKDCRVNSGSYFESGNFAIAEGAIAAGLDRFYGYPITPATEIMELIAERFANGKLGGAVYQMEDEIASITACIGSSWTGGKTMTATSGPGFSLMQEGIGLASFTETPMVIVDSMRMGPSTGNPTLPSQADLMQTRFGSHGDYINLTLAPSSVQECFDFTVEAFRLSELLRVPVVLLVDQTLSSIHEDFEIPAKEDIPTSYRPLPKKSSLPHVDPMPIFGRGYKGFSSGLAHGKDGTPDLRMEVHEELIKRLLNKLTENAHLLPQPHIFSTDNVALEDCDIVFIAYGSTVRSIQGAIRKGKRDNLQIGCIALKTLWPFPVDPLRNLINEKSLDRITAVDLSMGQLIWPLRRFLDRIEIDSFTYVKGQPIPPSKLVQHTKQRLG